MTRHIAITDQPRQLGRWQQAFPQGEVYATAEIDQIEQGDCIWLTAEEGWPEHVRRLAHKAKAVVVMANNPVGQQAMQALAAGARGYIHALSPAAALHQVETVVLNQGLWVGADLLAQVAGAAFNAMGGNTDKIDHLAPLTDRERMVARAVANGRTNKEVARELDITERTVKAHMSAIFQKLGVRDRLQLVRLLATPGSA